MNKNTKTNVNMFVNIRQRMKMSIDQSITNCLNVH
uniref:Uncharacterized protein n=1 Tax=Anguilla anguilla TaxID=7936 RepID=A0A0E9VC48_ANGAN